MATGTINVQTENIFPVIKKFLYSDHEIFLRELVSNAVDASQKLNVLGKNGEYKGEIGDLTIDIILDEKAGTLTVRDRGVGMNAEEIDKYINQIAFSGAEEFVQKYKGKEGADQIIGHFGLGFYSAFMVASKVEIKSKSFKGDDAVHWVSEGTPEYTLETIEKEDRGTEIILHIADDSKEFLENGRIAGILDKYCKFLPINIRFGQTTEQQDDPSGEKDEDGNVKKVSVEVDNIVNNTHPAWTKTPADLSDEDYKAFYRELYPMTFDEPMFHIHLNVDYPFNLTGILYFPKIKENVEVQKNKIQLYSNQVFITNNVEEIVPEFLTLLHGVIDSPDIPLNVSRSYLQSDSNVKKISSHITKKVADKLREMFNKDREDFESKWDDLKIFVEYGMLSDEKFGDKAKAFSLLKNTEGKYFTFEEYQDKIKGMQTDKNDKIVHLYTNDAEAQFSFIQAAKDRGYDVLELGSPLASHWISKVEQQFENVSFARVDADTLDQLIDKEEEKVAKHSEEEKESLKKAFQTSIDEKKFQLQVADLTESEAPVMITQAEFMRRMQDQQKLGGGGMFGAFPEMYNLVINANHPVMDKLLEAKTDKKREKLASQLKDLAMLSQGMLKGEALSQFVNRSIDIIK